MQVSHSSLQQLRLECARALVKRARPVQEGEGSALGLGVNLEKSEFPPTTLITTAEAIVALGPQRDSWTGEYARLKEGLLIHWRKHREKAESLHNSGQIEQARAALTTRHKAWYVLAMISTDDSMEVKNALGYLLRDYDSSLEGGVATGYRLWEDDPRRSHEIYSQWIATWAAIEGLWYVVRKRVDFDRVTHLREAAEAGLGLLMRSLTSSSAGKGFPFTARLEGVQSDEREPNPSMTAYVLFLLGRASRYLGHDWISEGLEAYDYLVGQRQGDRGIWNSYREPYQEGSEQGEFEHFTTCWVAHAFWASLTSGVEIDESVSRKWLWSLAQAIRSLFTDLQVDGRPGQLFVDLGSPRDLSFAISDFLMLLNSFALDRVLYPGEIARGDEAGDSFLERLMSTADIDIAIDSMEALVPLASVAQAQKVLLSQISDKIESEASGLRALEEEILQKQRQREELIVEIEGLEKGRGSLSTEVALIRTDIANVWDALRKGAGRAFAPLIFTGMDFVGTLVLPFALGLCFVCRSSLSDPKASPGKFLAYMVSCLVGLLFSVVLLEGSFRQLRSVWKRGPVPYINFMLFIGSFIGILSTSSLFMRGLMSGYSTGILSILSLLLSLASAFGAYKALDHNRKAQSSIAKEVLDNMREQ